MQAKVSMVTPCYNKGPFIGAMLRSVYNQKWDNIELILVYDASTDNTYDVIKEWAPRLEQRGYTVVIIEREENNGLSLALLDGIRRMTGDYFCTVDCDDEIYPEYVSTMVSWLEEHEDYDLAACGYTKLQIKDGGKQSDVTIDFIAKPDSPTLVEDFLFARSPMTAWIYMVRAKYIEKCKLIENFPTESSISQEPPLVIALAAGGGRLKYFPKPLYKYYYRGSMRYLLSLVKRNPLHGHQYAELCRITVEHLDIDRERKRRLLDICQLASTKLELYFNADYCENEELRLAAAIKAAADANSLLLPSPGITPEKILESGYRSFYYAVENCVLGRKNKYLPKIPQPTENCRVIGYGALGNLADELLPPLMASPLRPNILWDISAVPGDTRFGIPVQKPDFSVLEPIDIVLVIPRIKKVWEYVENATQDIGGVTCFRHFDLLEYIAACNFPKIQENCKIYSTAP